MSELERIRTDLARAKQRVSEIESGQRGVRSVADWRAGDDAGGGSIPGAGHAAWNQLQAQRAAVTRLESELLNAMLSAHKWSPDAIIEAMTRPPTVVEKIVEREVIREPSNADVIAKLREFLTTVPPTTTAAQLQELIS